MQKRCKRVSILYKTCSLSLQRAESSLHEMQIKILTGCIFIWHICIWGYYGFNPDGKMNIMQSVCKHYESPAWCDNIKSYFSS